MFKPRFRWLIVVALSLLAHPAFAQRESPRSPIPVEVHGQVRYAQGGAPADRVLVRLESFSGGIVGEITTDRTGKFRFSGLTPALYLVTIHLPGYKDEQQQIDLQTRNSDYVLFQLRADPADSTVTTAAADAAAPALLDAKVPVDARKEYELGRNAILDEGRAEKGITHLEKAISLYKDFLEAELLLGTAYMDTRQFDKAERALRRALEINSQSPSPMFALGELYRQQKKYQEAERSLLTGLKLQERSWQGHLTLARVYYEMGDMAKAGPQVGKALVLKPDLAEAYLLGGNILLRAHKPKDALSEFEEYLRLAPEGRFAAQTREMISKIKKALAAQR